jgi:integrase
LYQIKKRKVITDIKSVSIEEFTNLLDLVTRENSVFLSGDKKGQNFYRDWFKIAFKLGLFTGGRREEVVKLKWNGIKLTKDGGFSHIEIDHFKINRANKHSISEKEYAIKKVPINEDLEHLLIELGYAENVNADKYILAPEETAKREYIMALITTAFSHYYKLLGTGETKQFKHLRKSYITALYIKRGDKANEDSEHEGMDILHSSYIDKNAVMEAKRKEFKKMGSLFKNS